MLLGILAWGKIHFNFVGGDGLEDNKWEHFLKEVHPEHMEYRMRENFYQLSDWRLVSIIYEELQKFNTKIVKIPINKWAVEMSRQFSKTKNTKANKYF